MDFSFGKKDRTFVVNASVFSRKEKDVFVYNWDNRKFLNVESNKVKGVELGVQYHFNEKVNVGGNFSFAEKDNPATRLRSPKQRANAFLEILPIKNNRINISYQYTSKRNDAYYDSSSFSTKNVELEAFHLFNLNINQKITKSLDTYLNVGNVLNTSYTDVIGYTTKPRNITLGVEYKF